MASVLLFACLLTFGIELGFSRVHIPSPGKPTAPNEFPWVVSLKYINWRQKNSTHIEGVSRICGGALLALNKDDTKSDIVLTAAHCIVQCEDDFAQRCVKVNDHVEAKKLNISAGNHLQSREDEKGEEHRHPSRFVFHPEWTRADGWSVDDIAIIKLERPFYFTKQIKGVYLPEQDASPNDPTLCIVAGWGRFDAKNDNTSEELRSMRISEVYSGEKCGESLVSEDKYDAVLCAEGETQKATFCEGDSGSPLWCSSKDGPIVYGVVNGGEGLCGQSKLTVYAKVSHYVKWIKDTIERLNGEKRI